MADRSTLRVLERALCADPDDLATHQAYADALIESGDPRGEFIQVQLALEDADRPPEERRRLTAREAELLRLHQREWLGDDLCSLLDASNWDVPQGFWREGHAIRFARGWLHSLGVPSLNVANARRLARAPAVRLLRSLQILDVPFESEGEFEPGVELPPDTRYGGPFGLYPLRDAPFVRHLRRFTVGVYCEDLDHRLLNCTTDAEGAADLIAGMPVLEDLALYSHRIDAEKLFRLPNVGHLRRLSMWHGARHPFQLLAENPAWSRLETLIVHPHAFDAEYHCDIDDLETSYVKFAAFQALVGSPHLHSLRHVTLRMTAFGDRGIGVLVRSGVLARWKRLDLSLGNVTDEGARLLAACPAARQLEFLDLSKNAMTPAGISLLREAGLRFKADAQHRVHHLDIDGEEFEDDTPEYMFEGDIE